MSSRLRHDRRRHPLSELGRLPAVVPHHACIRCMRGPTERGFIVEGDREFVGACLHVYAGLDMDEALGIATLIFEERGAPFEDRPVSFIRLCRGCARTTGAHVYAVATLNDGGKLSGLLQN